jgi:uncharacterized membrane protein
MLNSTRGPSNSRLRYSYLVRTRLRVALLISWLLIVLAGSAMVFWYVLRGGPPVDTPDRAQVWGTLWAVAVAVPSALWWAWNRRRPAPVGMSTAAQVRAAADQLADQTLHTWSQQVMQRGIQTPAPVRVGWRWAAEEVALPMQELAASPSLATDPTPIPAGTDERSGTAPVLSSGVVTRLHEDLYTRLHHGKLVLMGGPGAGKTGAMILLLIEALRHRELLPDGARAHVPVPVWLTLGSWEPSLQGLRDWVTATIRRDHPYLAARDFGPTAVNQLFDSGRIALFLDGLDEMPEGLRDEAIERLSSEAAGLRMVVTSRPEKAVGSPDPSQRLPYTAVVALQPVDPATAAEYLLEGQIGATKQAWQEVAEHIVAHPDGVLARTLNTPLTLSLARGAYIGGDPRVLLKRELADESALRGHLLDQVLSAAYPDVSEREHINYWLGWLAHHMNTRRFGATRDLVWWRIPGWVPAWRVGLAGTLVGGLAAGLALLITTGIGYMLTSTLPFTPSNALLLMLAVGLLIGYESLGGEWLAPQSRTIRWLPWRNHHLVSLDAGRSVLVMWPVLLAICLVALFGWLGWWWLGAKMGGGLLGRLAVALLAAQLSILFFGLFFGTVSAADRRASQFDDIAANFDASPRSIYRQDVRSNIAEGALKGLMTGLLLWLIAAVVLGLIFEPLTGLRIGLLIGLGAGLFVGFAFWSEPEPEVGAAASLGLAELALLLQGRRVRFMHLLETALARQVLRQAGAVYQFRHAELQDRLAEQYETHGPQPESHVDRLVRSIFD